MDDPVIDLLSDGLASPLGDVIASVGRGVAEAQAALDAASLRATLAIYQDDDADAAMLRDIGYQPTFYVLPETTCEVQVSMRIGGNGATDGSAGDVSTPGRARTYITPVDAGFQQRYGFLAQGAARLSFKIVPVPPPAALDNVRPVPDVVTLSAPEAVARLQQLGLSAQLVDVHGKVLAVAAAGGKAVVSQDVPPNSLRTSGELVTLTVG